MLSLKKVCIIGAGTMGSSIAQWFCQQGLKVELTDNNEDLLNETYKKVIGSWDKLSEKGKFSSQQVQGFKQSFKTCSFEDFSQDADLMIEAVIESLEVKQTIFKKAASFFPKTILATNTSSLSIKEISNALSKNDQQRFIGLHFFNPATIMKLVEIIPNNSLQEKLVLELKHWFSEHQKKPAVCQDSPGFIVNRVARSFYGEPLHAVSSDNEDSFREIDLVLKEVGGFKMGPFELMDLIGIDINFTVTQTVWKAYHESPRFRPHPLQEKRVKEGSLGRKSGKGFYQYE